MSRITRSQSRQNSQRPDKDGPDLSSTQSSEHLSLVAHLKNQTPAIRYLTEQELAKELLRLRKADARLLLSKRKSLQKPTSSVSNFNLLHDLHLEGDGEVLTQATAATLVFAAESAGTAICISPLGLLLTCAHCIAESEGEFRPDDERWLLFASGDPVRARCIAWDARRDLALLQITTARLSSSPSSSPMSHHAFPHAKVAERAPKPQTRLICIGHPGSEDFEADRPGVATGYDVLHVSEGRFRGLARDQDPENNSEIGALMHDCWTYWGHSGAPLIARPTGLLVGLHSSWDDETGMRRGVALGAIRSFLAKHTVSEPGLG